jgi:Rrf2 family protein
MAQQKLETPVSTKVISSATGIPNVFLLKALKPCVAQRLLDSITGPNGGYRLAKNSSAISLLDVIEAVDGPYGVHDTQTSAYGDPGVDAQLEKLLNDAAKRVRDVYASMTVAQLAAKKKNKG